MRGAHTPQFPRRGFAMVRCDGGGVEILQLTVGFGEAEMIVQRTHSSQRRRFAMGSLPRRWKLNHDSAHLLFCWTGDSVYPFSVLSSVLFSVPSCGGCPRADFAAHYSVAVHLYLGMDESVFSLLHMAGEHRKHLATGAPCPHVIR